MSETLFRDNFLTDKLLRNWIRCRRRAWLDKHENANRRIWTAHRALQLDNQQKSFVSLMPKKPGRGIEACKKGEAGVLGLRIKGSLISGQFIEVHPPLLQRIKGKSRWGDFAYRPLLAKQGKKITREHKLGLSLYALLLEQLQKSKVAEGLIVSSAKQVLKVEKIQLTDSLHYQLIDSLQKLSKDLNKQKAPEIASDRRKCSLCPWRGVCNEEASQNGYLSEVIGIGGKRKEILEKIGIKNLYNLSNANTKSLKEKLKEFGEKNDQIAEKLIGQAKVQYYGYIERININPVLPELINAPGLLIYDIESDPDERHDFLHGFVEIKKANNGTWNINEAKYRPLLWLYKNHEPIHWERLYKKLKKYPRWPILHYGETEALSLCNIGKKHGLSDKEIIEIRKRLIDIHARVRKHWRLPLNSYGLKTVASWSGFKWRQYRVDGPKALLWWRQWRDSIKNGKRTSNNLKWIFKYNEDDCLATWSVADWLIRND